MTIVIMQVFVSLLLVGGSLVLFLHSVRQRDFDHADRLSLAPLEDDDRPNPKDDKAP
jgi:cbb3-type cytochrome oxidase maturation protein